MIEIKGLVKTYGIKRAVDGVSFTVRRGDILGFLGPNGAGKSTTMKMLTGFLRPDAGTALVDGLDVTADPVGVKRKIGCLPENSPAPPATETIPAGPAFAFITCSDASAPVNALMKKRAFEIYDYSYTSLPEKPADLFVAAPPPKPAAPAKSDAKAPSKS